MAWTTWRNPTSVTTDNFTNPNSVLSADGTYATWSNSGLENIINTYLRFASYRAGTYGSLTSTDTYYTTGDTDAFLSAAVVGGTLEASVMVYDKGYSIRANVYATGFNFTDLPTGAVIGRVEAQALAHLSGTTIYVDNIQTRVDWSPPPVILGAGIASGEAMGVPTFARAPFYVTPNGLASAAAFGQAVITIFITGVAGAATSEGIGQPTITQGDPPPPPDLDWSALGKEDEKRYLYKVYKHDGTYVGTWNDVKDELNYSQRLYTPGTTTTVRLARSPNTTKEVRDQLATEGGEVLTDETGDPLIATYQTNNTVGDGTDCDVNYNVDVYVIYGGYDYLVTQDGEPITTEDGEAIIVEYGAPNGVRVFSGYILDYEFVYGEETGVTVTLASHGIQLSNELVRSGATTTVTYASSTLESQVKSILDTNPGTITYSGVSIGTTGVSDASTFILNTKLEAIESLYNRTAAGWYWYVNVADNYLYLKPTSVTPDHVFIMGQHIKTLKLKRSIEQIRNAVWFVGGEVAGTPVYKYYDDPASQSAWRKGIVRITDRRYTVPASMQKRADNEMSRFKGPVYTSTVEISSAKYDLESISLGQTVAFRNASSIKEDLVLQIVSLQYTPTKLTLGLGELLDTSAELEAGLEERVQNETYVNIPSAPA